MEHSIQKKQHTHSSGIGHMLGHKTSLNKFKKINIISTIVSDHNVEKSTSRNKVQKTQLCES